ncbi:helix-turn-helix domain-containing protein [Actinoplanes sp. NPDC024001]|uniref:helix-turn-helix domain-containing protein n=1 Tax=Actinoplanes sp. NPDC024001 TaxID=3154598 RepID=UPI0034053375
MRRTRWTAEAVRELGLTTDIETAASILNVGRSKAYALAKNGDFPVRVIRVGRSYVVPVSALRELLGI